MAPFGDRAGTASALMGTMQFTIAGLASATVGHYEGNGAVPMASMMATCAVTAWLLLRWVRRQV
jgi:DHA1 family bicyclomycin/chloramphenicol resistance-like MFS transporter